MYTLDPKKLRSAQAVEYVIEIVVYASVSKVTLKTIVHPYAIQIKTEIVKMI